MVTDPGSRTFQSLADPWRHRTPLPRSAWAEIRAVFPDGEIAIEGLGRTQLLGRSGRS